LFSNRKRFVSNYKFPRHNYSAYEKSVFSGGNESIRKKNGSIHSAEPAEGVG
jgi:hypothetical protein